MPSMRRYIRYKSVGIDLATGPTVRRTGEGYHLTVFHKAGEPFREIDLLSAAVEKALDEPYSGNIKMIKIEV